MTTTMTTTQDPTPAAVGKRPAAALSRVAQRDWALWVDWCAATSRDPHRAEIADLGVFLLELPATAGVQDRRIRNIARTLGRPGQARPCPAPPRPRPTVHRYGLPPSGPRTPRRWPRCAKSGTPKGSPPAVTP